MQTPLQILNDVFNYKSFRPQQEEIINHILARKDTMVLMPTGGGKSLCYQIPALIFEGTTVVISPLISLMKDQVDSLNANRISAAAFNSTNTESMNLNIRTRTESGELKILYISPERLQREIPWLQRINIPLFAIDEAHCISQWGHDFRPEYTQLKCLHQMFPKATIMALTATADELTKEDIVKQLNFRTYKIFSSSFDRPNLSLDVKKGYSEQEKLKAILSIISKHQGEAGIIYCLSRINTENLAQQLKANGVSAIAYHAGMDTKERNAVQEDFINNKINLVCATIAFGMGINKSNVRFVIHYNLPKNIEGFYQEIGRAGRDGHPSETVLFYNIQDIAALRNFVNESGQKEINIERLERMQEYAESLICRRRILLNYFGESTNSDCGNCDICKNPPQHFDGTKLVQKALSAIKRTNEQIGFSTTSQILRGINNEANTQNGYNKIKTFGIGSNVSSKLWHNYLIQMLHLGYIKIAYNENSHLKITQSGNEVLFGNKRVELASHANKEPEKDNNNKEKKPYTISRKLIIENKIDGKLFEILRKLRKKIADDNNCSEESILSHKSLKEIASTRPQTNEDLHYIYGFDEKKIELFGQKIIDAVREYMER
jgi:ATP-dependent DNA helicase RecQ